ncbi:SDR family NAD(P)-dependent oxidoreductase [Novosphingobium colocasiae]|uniref:2,5-dichloro-2,5-cyclohexadiene-1,4-diol dehydrogenase n=1 Tax=Novosphingobium colocasiae TaxID=1256513 RepID=A0A918P9N1_9SPHN|nr:SDR family oxidoreductase [Novosphingobium colocasiae]GGY92685.1 2,5-dichloro-2,5-cyclohexadiene-1,4-diol dehydrogenase [Novosphingobium colocasiae]
MSGRLDGKVVIITGGVSGIGLASVERAIEEGARVVIGDIQDDQGNALVDRFKSAAVYQHTNVMQEDAIAAMVDAAVTSFGRLDAIFNNAGALGSPASMLDITAQDMEKTLALLTTSVTLGHKYAARQFIKQGGGGSIVSTSSAAGLEGGWSAAGYTIAKHAVIGVIHQAVVELGRHGIRSNAICPGVIMTPIMAASFGVPAADSPAFEGYLHKQLGPKMPAGRLGLPQDIAEVFCFLASDAASYVSGVAIPVDGGCTAVTMGSFAVDVVQAAEDFRQGAR